MPTCLSYLFIVCLLCNAQKHIYLFLILIYYVPAMQFAGPHNIILHIYYDLLFFFHADVVMHCWEHTEKTDTHQHTQLDRDQCAVTFVSNLPIFYTNCWEVYNSFYLFYIFIHQNVGNFVLTHSFKFGIKRNNPCYVFGIKWVSNMSSYHGLRLRVSSLRGVFSPF